MRRIGIYSGTFDPVHYGHIAFAASAIRACNLDEVVFLPEPQPRYKAGVTDIAHRLALLTMATAAQSNLTVAALNSSYFTAKSTLPELKQLFSGAEFTLLLGSDVAKMLAHWDDLRLLLSEVSLAIGLRAGSTSASIKNIINRIEHSHSIPVRYTFISTPHRHLASSLIRRGEADPMSEIGHYIKKHKLYNT